MFASRDIYVLVCVSLDLLWCCMFMACGFLADSLCVIFCVLTVFGVLFHWNMYWYVFTRYCFWFVFWVS
jgi:hypothetical protein